MPERAAIGAKREERTNLDLTKLPESVALIPESGSVTIGDLHGNTLKFIHFLLREGIIGFKKEVTEPAKEYKKLVLSYQLACGLFNAHIPVALQAKGKNDKNFPIFDTVLYKQLDQHFKTFMQNIEVKNKHILVRCIGDCFADRGGNDKWTLDVLKFLKKGDVPITILLSNHDLDFISYYEATAKDKKIIRHLGYDGGLRRQALSLFALESLIEVKLLENTEFMTSVNSVYKPTLKLIDYTFTEKGIRLFTHAPIAFEAIQKMAEKLKIPYRDKTREDLARTINTINQKIQENVAANTIHLLWKGQDPTNGEISLDHPFLHFLWNRFSLSNVDSLKKRPCKHNGYTIHYVHGHDSSESGLNHVDNLDNDQGKSNEAEFNTKPYKVLYSDENIPELSLVPPSPSTSPIRTGAIVGGIASVGTGAIASSIVIITALSLIAPPLGLGLIALIGAAVAVSVGVGLMTGAIAAKYQSNINASGASTVSHALRTLGRPVQSTVGLEQSSESKPSVTAAPAVKQLDAASNTNPDITAASDDDHPPAGMNNR